MIYSGTKKVLSCIVFYFSALLLIALGIAWDSYVRSQESGLGGHDFEQGGLAGFQFGMAVYSVALLLQSVAYVVPLIILTIRSRDLGDRLFQCAVASGVICAASLGLFVWFGPPLDHWAGLTAATFSILVPGAIIFLLMQHFSQPLATK